MDVWEVSPQEPQRIQERDRTGGFKARDRLTAAGSRDHRSFSQIHDRFCRAALELAEFLEEPAPLLEENIVAS